MNEETSIGFEIKRPYESQICLGIIKAFLERSEFTINIDISCTSNLVDQYHSEVSMCPPFPLNIMINKNNFS